MITPSKAAKIALDYSGHEQVVCVKNYDLIHYAVETLPRNGKLPGQGTCTTFFVNKLVGTVSPLYLRPFGTLEKFQNAKCYKLM